MSIPIDLRTQTQTQIKKEEPPSKYKLELMLANNLDDSVKTFIEKFKLPYTVEREGDKFILRDTLSQGELELNKFITVDPHMIQMKKDASLIAPTEYSVLITGETGTGKEIIAKAMIGTRKGPVKAVNCGGMPLELIESELFGHVKGAFTGAETTKQGLMTAASNGVMFLDEIAELPLATQAKLLRALQENRIRKVGSLVEEEINCKFVCATHRTLKEMVTEGKFRQDLYARISTLELDITPLRDRMCDLEPITKSIKGGDKFLNEHAIALRAGRFDISLNVRSLQQHVIRCLVFGRVNYIT